MLNKYFSGVNLEFSFDGEKPTNIEINNAYKKV